MNYNKLNKDWNADPNAPEVTIEVKESTVMLDFYLDGFVYNFKEGQRGKLTFMNCHKYSFNSMNDEGYFREQYRYKHEELPWGEFYELKTNWETDFPKDAEVLNLNPNRLNLKHYIFFLRDDTFECVAENYSFEIFNP